MHFFVHLYVGCTMHNFPNYQYLLISVSSPSWLFSKFFLYQLISTFNSTVCDISIKRGLHYKTDLKFVISDTSTLLKSVQFIKYTDAHAQWLWISTKSWSLVTIPQSDHRKSGIFGRFRQRFRRKISFWSTSISETRFPHRNISIIISFHSSNSNDQLEFFQKFTFRLIFFEKFRSHIKHDTLLYWERTLQIRGAIKKQALNQRIPPWHCLVIADNATLLTCTFETLPTRCNGEQVCNLWNIKKLLTHRCWARLGNLSSVRLHNYKA